MSGRETLEELLALDDEAGPARRLSPSHTDAMVEGVLDQWTAGPATGPGGGAPAGGARGVGGWLLGGALAVVAVGGVVLGVLWSPGETPEPVVPSAVQPTEPPPDPAVATGDGARAEPAPSAQERDGVDDGSLGSADPPSAEPDRPRRRRAREGAPEDLLDRGNRLRREGRWREAEQAYLAAMDQRPGSLTAQVAGVAAGSIRLDHRGDARGAMALFRRALRAQPAGPLALEAREGLARAARRAGDAETERATLRAILEHHPGTPAADRARTRLGAIEADDVR